MKDGFQNLDVYQRASRLFPKVYEIVRSWEAIDQRELGSQLIRAANSIHVNVAEGYAKSSNDFKRYLGIAIGSCNEVTSHLNDAKRIGLVSEAAASELLKEYDIVVKQLAKLKQRWR